MAGVSPQTFFRFAAEHHELLVEIYQRRDGLSEAELYALVRRFQGEASPGAAYLVGRLRELGFIDTAPQATAQFEMSRPFAELMASLLREFRLTSVEVIRGYFTALDAQAGEMARATAKEDADRLVRALRETSEHVERMRHDSRLNREEIIATVMRVKSNRDRIPPRRRYAEINGLWTRYLVPLRDMIDTEKAMDASLDRMEGTLAEAETRFRLDGAVVPTIRGGQARVRRMRREVVDDFRESMREITPLYEELRRENLLARGASAGLERIVNRGVASLGLPRRLGLCVWRRQGLFSDGALRAFLLGARRYRPARPRPIRAPALRAARDHLRTEAVEARASDALPIPNALAWLADTYPDLPLGQILKLYGRLHDGRLGRRTFGDKPARTTVAGATLTAHPMRLDAKEAAAP